MAMNPMQRKANNYLLIGILVTAFIAGIFIVLLFMQLNNLQLKLKESEKNIVNAYVLKQDIKSGQIVSADMFTMKSVNKDLIPANATGEIEELINSINLEDSKGRSISVDVERGMYFTDSEVKITSEGNSYYYMNNGAKEYIELVEVPVIAKIDISANTVVTSSMLAKSDEKTTNDLRKQEYNMIILPTQIQSGDYVDIRLKLSDGVDYIVATKKCIEIPTIDGIDSPNTIIMNMNEIETMVMSNAIIEAYIDKGSTLYATTYVEPGMQKNVIPTYIPSGRVQVAINANSNIAQEAKNALFARYNQNRTIREDMIESNLAQYAQDRVDNIEEGVQEQITKAREERQTYLESLGGY